MRTDSPPYGFGSIFNNLGDMAWMQLSSQPALKQLFSDYRPWRKFKYIAKDFGVDPEQAWRAAKFLRLHGWRQFDDLSDMKGSPFGVCLDPDLFEALHRIDRATGGGGPAAIASNDGVLADEQARRQFRIRTLMDEAAESSIIEGAARTRKDAVELIRSGREPRDKHERMIVNNYVAMQQIKTLLLKDLTPEVLIKLQATLTKGTLKNDEEVGRLRRADEKVYIVDRDEVTIHVPPPATELPARLHRLCDFANVQHTGDKFLHPIIKASILHFMIGYEHPFVDGNGRTARAIFYWYALKCGYSIFEYLSISEIIRKGDARYSQAYVDTEVDDGDLTYFARYKLNVIEQSLDRLAEHLQREEKKIKASEQLLHVAKDLNLRQRLLLEHALRHPGTAYTVKSHSNSNGITLVTARTDLDDLVRRRLMTTSKRGKEVLYHVTRTLRDRLAKKGL